MPNNPGGRMKPLTKEQMVRDCFGPYLYENDTDGILLKFAKCARRFVRMEQAQKDNREWNAFKKRCREMAREA